MIKNILYVEDGSVDVDELIDSMSTETKIIVYRQGSTPPILIQPEKPIQNDFDYYLVRLEKKLETVKKVLEDTMQMKKSKKLAKKT